MACSYTMEEIGVCRQTGFQMLLCVTFAFPLLSHAASHDSMMSSVNHQTSLSLYILHTINNAIERGRKVQSREASSCV